MNEKNIEKILGAFMSDTPFSRTFVLVGEKGSGKTAMLSNISNELKKDESWMIVNLAPDCEDMVEASVYEIGKDAGMSVENEEDFQYYNISMLRMVLDIVKEKGKKVLFIIDDIEANAELKSFVSWYQILLRESYPVFLLMAGTHKDVMDVQNGKTTTFLYRAIKVKLS